MKILYMSLAASMFIIMNNPVFAKNDIDNKAPEGVMPMQQGMGAMYGNPEKIRKYLGLSDDQVDKIQKINVKYTGQYKQLNDKIRPKVDELKKLAKADKIDADKIKAAYSDISSFQDQMRMLRLNHFLDIEHVLTPDQSKKVRNELPFLKDDRMMKGKFRNEHDKD